MATYFHCNINNNLRYVFVTMTTMTNRVRKCEDDTPLRSVSERTFGVQERSALRADAMRSYIFNILGYFYGSRKVPFFSKSNFGCAYFYFSYLCSEQSNWLLFFFFNAVKKAVCKVHFPVGHLERCFESLVTEFIFKSIFSK